jgi:hypothetical protein
MSKSNEFDLLRKFVEWSEEREPEMQLANAQFDKYVGDLWPVISKCREVALKHPETLVLGWLAISVELYKAPWPDITPLYEAVIGFVQWYYDLFNAAHA